MLVVPQIGSAASQLLNLVKASNAIFLISKKLFPPHTRSLRKVCFPCLDIGFMCCELPMIFCVLYNRLTSVLSCVMPLRKPVVLSFLHY